MYIDEIRNAIIDISEGNLNIRLDVKSLNEIGRTANAVNIMTEKIGIAIEKERELEKKRSELITNISHDLRTPLTSIMGYLNLIKESEFSSLDELALYSKTAYRKSEYLKSLIDQLFEYSKLVNKDIEIKKTKINMNEFSEQIFMSFIPVFEKKKYKYCIEHKNHPLYSNIDIMLFRRLYENLLQNAVKYSDPGSRIEICLGKLEDKVVIEFKNQSDKIGLIDTEKIFDRNFKLNSISESSGIGLAIVKQIVNLHSGYISAYREERQMVIKLNLELC